MSEPTIAALPFSTESEFAGMIDYFMNSSEEFLRGMGVNPAKLRSREKWLKDVLHDHTLPDNEKDRCYVAWYYDGVQVGHSSINYIKPGVEANIHLHMWREDLRGGGVGMRFFRTSVNYFMGRFHLQRLLCEPFADNPAPNRVLTKLGFRFIKRHRIVPGPYNDEQDVNLYVLDHLLV